MRKKKEEDNGEKRLDHPSSWSWGHGNTGGLRRVLHTRQRRKATRSNSPEAFATVVPRPRAHVSTSHQKLSSRRNKKKKETSTKLAYRIIRNNRDRKTCCGRVLVDRVPHLVRRGTFRVIIGYRPRGRWQSWQNTNKKWHKGKIKQKLETQKGL